MIVERPLDLLNNAKGLEILVYCKENKIFSGKLVAFDIHINLAIEDMKDVSDKEHLVKLGDSFIRGDSINFVSPRKE